VPLVSSNINKDFVRLARKRKKQLKSSFRDIVEKEDTEAVHDFRKTTRHLQTILKACCIGNGKHKAQRIDKQLKLCRHALGEWRDGDVMLDELDKARRKSTNRGDRESLSLVMRRTAKSRDRAIKEFRRQRQHLRVAKTGSAAQMIAKKESRAGDVLTDLERLIEHAWFRWNESIDACLASNTSSSLHAVRIKSKSLRYALELSARFYPDREFESFASWLKRVQDRVGAWHDEFTLSERARETLSRPDRSADLRGARLVRSLKQREIEMARQARRYVISIRKSNRYRRIERHLSASVFAMSSRGDELAAARQSLSGPLS
jgi:CHAD domain-containing protein